MYRAANGVGLVKARTKPASAIGGAVAFRVHHGILGTKPAGAEATAKLAERRYLRIKELP